VVSRLAARTLKGVLVKAAMLLPGGTLAATALSLAVARMVAVAPMTAPTAVVEPTVGAVLARERARAEPDDSGGAIELSDQE
jgi:hypothetical protein